jgi:hypothetical protein
MKRFIGYFVYVAALGCFVIIADNFERHLKDLYQLSFDKTNIWLFFSMAPVMLGFLLALPRLIKTFKKEGYWQVDWILLLSAGLPSLLVAITPIMCLVQSVLYSKYALFTFGLHPNLITLSGIIFGYVLLAAFKKASPEISCQTE